MNFWTRKKSEITAEKQRTPEEIQSLFWAVTNLVDERYCDSEKQVFDLAEERLKTYQVVVKLMSSVAINYSILLTRHYPNQAIELAPLVAAVLPNSLEQSPEDDWDPLCRLEELVQDVQRVQTDVNLLLQETFSQIKQTGVSKKNSPY